MSSLLVKTFVGFIALILILALCLFIPAGTLSFWQAWVYLGVFSVCAILITVYLILFDQKLLASRVSAGPTAETQKSQQLIQSLASLFFIGIFVVSGLDYRFDWSDVPLALIAFSDAMVVVGFFLVFLVFKENSYTSATIEVSDEQTVISSGLYSVVRHPMYAGAIPLLIFTPLALGSWIAVPLAVPLILVIVARLLAEEKFLDERLSGYRAYRQKVRYRLIPFVW
jgi:protein-S-isoprenylcysteine O-methyltransferase Ste14